MFDIHAVFDPASDVSLKIKRTKDRFMLPLITVMRWLGVSPNTVSLIGLLIGLFSVWLLWQGLYWWFVSAMFVSTLLDGVDGAYARAIQRTTVWGSHLDRAIDIVLMTLMYAGLVIFLDAPWWWIGLTAYSGLLVLDAAVPKDKPMFPGRMALFVPTALGFPRIGMITLIVYGGMAGIRIARQWLRKR